MSAASPRHLRLLLGSVATAATLGAIAAACGGSASESPWPVPPDEPILGPEGEDGKSLRRAADAGADAPDTGAAPPNVEP